jgi:hypothetical protein
MGTVIQSSGKNQVASIKTDGTRKGASLQGRELTAEQQQELRVVQKVRSMPKGSNISFTIANGHASNAQSFILFDVCGAAAANGATAQGADITITSTFVGLGSTTGYTVFKEWLKGTHFGSIGTSFQASDEDIFLTSGIKIWTGNIEDYNGKSLKNYLLLSKDNYANDQKILNLSTELYVNGLFAITGTIPAQESLTILMNVPAFSNF